MISQQQAPRAVVGSALVILVLREEGVQRARPTWLGHAVDLRACFSSSHCPGWGPDDSLLEGGGFPVHCKAVSTFPASTRRCYLYPNPLGTTTRNASSLCQMGARSTQAETYHLGAQPSVLCGADKLQQGGLGPPCETPPRRPFHEGLAGWTFQPDGQISVSRKVALLRWDSAGTSQS